MVLLLLVLFLVAVTTIGPTHAQDSCGKEDSAVPPTIDLASSVDDGEVVRAVRQAAETWGFFHVTNHGLDARLLARAVEQMQRFFALPLAAKSSVRRMANNSRGFANDELTKQRRDRKEIFDFGRDDLACNEVDGCNQWPTGFATTEDNRVFHETMTEYFAACVNASLLVLDVMSRGLGLDPASLRAQFSNHTSFARLNYYPVEDEDEQDALGISRHTDAGGLTVLWQSREGLQVYSGTKEDNKDGRWVDATRPATSPESSLTVNIGDMMHVWTGGVLQAPEHRVLRSTQHTRYSMAFFFNPNYDAVIQPIPELEGKKQSYRPFTWSRFRAARFAGDYADVGVESQIEDWEILS